MLASYWDMCDIVYSHFKMTSVVHDDHSRSPLFTASDSSVASSEQEMVRRLTDARYNGRDDALEWLKASIRQCDGGHVPFSDPLSVFQGLSVALEDDEWDTRYQCVKVVGDLIPLVDTSDIECCMHEVLPQMVSLLGDMKITVITAAEHALCTYAEYTTDSQVLYEAIVDYGLKADDEKLRLSVAESIPKLLEVSYGRRPNIEHLIVSLIELTFDAHFVRPVEICLQKISKCVGMTEFEACVNQLPTAIHEQYYHIQNDGTVCSSMSDAADMLNGKSYDHDSPEGNTKDLPSPVLCENAKRSCSSSKKVVDVLYGVIPSKIVNNLNNCGDNRSLSQAIEELRMVVSDSEKVDQLQPYVSDFLELLSPLLEDGVSFQVLHIIITM